MSLLETLIPYLHWGAYALFAFAIVALGLSIYFFRRARIDPYYVMREKARKRGLSWFLGAVAALVIGAGLLYVRANPPRFPSPQPSPTPTATVTSTAVVTIRPPTATLPPLPTDVPSPTPTWPATATPPFIPTPTPAIPLPEGAVASLPGAAAAEPEAQIALVTFALGSEGGQPVDPGFEFPPGDYRIYLFFDYRAMTIGSTWTYAWYQNGEYLDGNTCPWAVSEDDCPQVTGRIGTTNLFLRPSGGYEPGIYEVRIWIEEQIQGTAQFIITEAP